MSVNIVNQTTGELTQVAGNATDKVGNLNALITTDKSSCVGAINEVKSGLTNIGSSTDLGNVQGSNTITLSDAVSNYRFVQILIGYYNSGYPCYGHALLPVSALPIGTRDENAITVSFSDRTGISSGKVDILFLSATSAKVVNTSDSVYTSIVGIG